MTTSQILGLGVWRRAVRSASWRKLGFPKYDARWVSLPLPEGGEQNVRTLPIESRRVMTIAELRSKNAALNDAIESFFRANYEISPRTEAWYRQNLRDYARFIERVNGESARVSDVNKTMADAFLKERRTNPTRKYPHGSAFAARAAATTIKRFASYLAEEGILADQFGISVLKTVKRGKVDKDVRRPLTDPESSRAVNAAAQLGDVARQAVLFDLGSGLRLNELREAQVGDLDLVRGEFNVRPETSKFGRGRMVSLHPELVRDMERYLRNRPAGRNPHAPLFPTRMGDPYTDDGFAKLFQRIKRTSGLTDFSAHLLRHTWATNFMRTPGANLLELKRQGGWERWEMVERYSHAVPMTDRSKLPNPMALHKTAFSQPPSTRVSRLSKVG